MAGAILGLGLGAAACESTQAKDKPEIEVKDDQTILQEAKEGHYKS